SRRRSGVNDKLQFVAGFAIGCIQKSTRSWKLVGHLRRSREMIITKKCLPRRTFLKGMGVAVALPMLDAMTPAFASPAEKVKAPLRLAFVYVPNGMEMKSWTPKSVG